jgi:hypothetical protein
LVYCQRPLVGDPESFAKFYWGTHLSSLLPTFITPLFLDSVPKVWSKKMMAQPLDIRNSRTVNHDWSQSSKFCCAVSDVLAFPKLILESVKAENKGD